MARGISSAMDYALNEGEVKPFFLIDLMLATPIYIWTGGYTLEYDQNDYIGAGDLLTVDVPEETQDIGASGVKLTLSGLSGTQILSAALQEEYQGKAVTIKLGAFNYAGDVVANPIIVFEGFMDVMQINEGAEQSSIVLTIENKLIRLESAHVFRYTDQDQKIDHPSDSGFSYVAKIQEKPIKWGL